MPIYPSSFTKCEIVWIGTKIINLKGDNYVRTNQTIVTYNLFMCSNSGIIPDFIGWLCSRNVGEAQMKMICGCYVNSKGFTVGYKYLTVYQIGTKKKIIAQVNLTQELIEKLTEIKEKFDSNDARRTMSVLELVDQIVV